MHPLTPLILLAPVVSAQAWTNCTSSVHLIGVRGHSYPHPNPDAWDVLGIFRDQMLAQIPGSDAVALPYDYTDTLPAGTGGVVNGSTLLSQYVKQYSASCPRSKIAILGFSEGAQATMDMLCGNDGVYGNLRTSALTSALSSNIVAVLLWGDENRTILQSYNVGTCPSITPGPFPRMNALACKPFAASIQSYCDWGDIYCCMGSTGQNPETVHASYVDKYSQAGVNFIKTRIGLAL